MQHIIEMMSMKGFPQVKNLDFVSNVPGLNNISEMFISHRHKPLVFKNAYTPEAIAFIKTKGSVKFLVDNGIRKLLASDGTEFKFPD